MQIISDGDNLHGISNAIFLEKKKRKILSNFRLLFMFSEW